MNINIIKLNKSKVELGNLINEGTIYIEASKIVKFQITKKWRTHELTLISFVNESYCIVSETPNEIIELINQINKKNKIDRL